MLKRPGGRHPIYSALGIGSPMLRACAALAAIEREWHRIVGPALALRSRPTAYEDGVLVVAVEGQLALQDMNFKKRQIIAAIRDNTWLDLSDIKIEPGRKTTHQATVMPAQRARRITPVKIDATALERLSGEILSAYPDLDPALAASIARCRLISGGQGQQR
ncbi:MAG: DUF721 domain-containing protein [Synergistaceae bacterium]|nr:DUF721 domain-containing protein [Synergistaceae bacterium]